MKASQCQLMCTWFLYLRYKERSGLDALLTPACLLPKTNACAVAGWGSDRGIALQPLLDLLSQTV